MGNEIFRAYDIRGIYNADLTEEIAENIGKAYGSVIDGKMSVAVARDVRISSTALATNLINGILSTGCNVIDFGAVPSPVLYYGVRKLNLGGGVMVTASHLPPNWNGFKFADENGIVISEGTGLEKVRSIFFSKDFIKGNKGTYTQYFGIVNDYVDFVSTKINAGKVLKIVVDYGNSVTAVVVPQLLKNLGMQIYEINEKLDVNVPNRSSELTDDSLQGLRRKVLEVKADIGIAYDGDGDRVAFVDEKGTIYNSGNILIPIFAEHILKQNPGSKIVFDVTCSSAVYDYIKSLGGKPIVSRVGHSYVARAVLENKALMGGQYSGHMCFVDMNCSDDAIYSSLKMLEILSSSNMRLSELAGRIPRYPATKITEIECDDQTKFLVINKIADIVKNYDYQVLAIDGIKIITESGWVLVRASNTSPIIRVNAEGKTIEHAIKMQEMGEKLVREAMKQ